MRIERLGDSAYILHSLSKPAYDVADALNGLNVPGLIEAWASYETVGIAVDPEVFDTATLGGVTSAEFPEKPEPRTLRVPVCFEFGKDLESVCRELSLSSEEVVAIFCGQPYACHAIGFCPGFPYLGYLDERLSGLARLAEPRMSVSAGSVAITGRQAAIYTLERPGGWRILGRTPLQLVDVEGDYFAFRAGDKVQFEPITVAAFASLEGKRL